MARKFIIDDLEIPDPSAVTVTRENIVSRDRTMNGTMVVDYIATKAKISVSWDALEDREFKKLLDGINRRSRSDHFYTLQFYEAEGPGETSVLKTMRAYSTSIQYYPYFLADDRILWRGISLAFEEV